MPARDTTPKCTGKEFEPGTCGVVWRGASLKRIAYCHVHGAAPDMLAALKSVRSFVYNAHDEGELEEHPYYADVCAAIKKAEGK